ncbi:hypothetical protein HPP92_015250 [Vanilla planifolia]|uniref:Uncharacterized protein n=1 Tax=Vanilla planifolia TaxID=51239 RepID=A0A835UTI1_VANPL|nr:hypothetical protein HPP92_015250 [Vanilla planifolia]
MEVKDFKVSATIHLFAQAQVRIDARRNRGNFGNVEQPPVYIFTSLPRQVLDLCFSDPNEEEEEALREGMAMASLARRRTGGLLLRPMEMGRFVAAWRGFAAAAEENDVVVIGGGPGDTWRRSRLPNWGSRPPASRNVVASGEPA